MGAEKGNKENRKNRTRKPKRPKKMKKGKGTKKKKEYNKKEEPKILQTGAPKKAPKIRSHNMTKHQRILKKG